MVEQILTAVIPVLATILIGFAWVRSGRSLESAALATIVADLGTPCLVFSNLARTEIPRDAFATLALASLASMVAVTALGAVVLAACGLKLRTFLPAVAFPNAGNLGLPMALNAFGREGLSYAIVYYTIIAIGNYTVGQAMAAGGANWRGLLRMPLLYAAILGSAVAIFRMSLPRWFGDTVTLVGSMSVPLMLLMLGASLARLKVAAVGRAAFVSALRIGLGGGVGLGVSLLFGLTGTAKSVFILQCAMPVAVYNYLFALRWNNDPEEVAGTVVVSTLAAIVSIPVLLALLL
jgi:malate permease and related proteins